MFQFEYCIGCGDSSAVSALTFPSDDLSWIQPMPILTEMPKTN